MWVHAYASALCPPLPRLSHASPASTLWQVSERLAAAEGHFASLLEQQASVTDAVKIKLAKLSATRLRTRTLVLCWFAIRLCAMHNRLLGERGAWHMMLREVREGSGLVQLGTGVAQVECETALGVKQPAELPTAHPKASDREMMVSDMEATLAVTSANAANATNAVNANATNAATTNAATTNAANANAAPTNAAATNIAARNVSSSAAQVSHLSRAVPSCLPSKPDSACAHISANASHHSQASTPAHGVPISRILFPSLDHTGTKQQKARPRADELLLSMISGAPYSGLPIVQAGSKLRAPGTAYTHSGIVSLQPQQAQPLPQRRKGKHFNSEEENYVTLPLRNATSSTSS